MEGRAEKSCEGGVTFLFSSTVLAMDVSCSDVMGLLWWTRAEIVTWS